ncbi:uncharacterized protein LOC123911357 [Trifolium pratense]|uniref:Uncharacterized protein n=1 Tax=Trifolium pratense TaxID=57577 RepID=A0ACB0JMW0_TRIPR|nr:uncharacterized protein LOC123911357 [Trifolium pratense]CAJ2644777.1 unnamed protein product [Trifolium pratense]
MKIKTFIFVLFLCAQILISVVTIELFKDEKQFGVREEFKTKVEINELGKTYWRMGRKPGRGKDKKDVQDPAVGSGSEGNSGEGGVQPIGVESGGEKEIGTDTNE